jgi:hypothetical protein
MDNSAVKSLATAVILQAVRDWRYLCKGGKETGDCNFEELEQFFESECENYLTGINMTANGIYKALKREKRKAHM